MNITLSKKQALVVELRNLLTMWNLTHSIHYSEDCTKLQKRITVVCNQLDEIEQQEQA